MDGSINNKKSKAAREFVRRLGVEKQQLPGAAAGAASTAGPATKESTTTSSEGGISPTREANRPRGQRVAAFGGERKGRVEIEASARRPWLPGGCGNFLEEQTRSAGPRQPVITFENGAVGSGHVFFRLCFILARK